MYVTRPLTHIKPLKPSAALRNLTADQAALRKEQRLQALMAKTARINDELRAQVQRLQQAAEAEPTSPSASGQPVCTSLSSDRLAGSVAGVSAAASRAGTGSEASCVLVRRCQLRPYQQTGVRWMVQLADSGLNGILADEMGLGKTVQTVVYIARRSYGWARRTMRSQAGAASRPPVFIVVCPLSVADGWIDSLARWLPCADVLRYQGPASERQAALATIRSGRTQGSCPIQLRMLEAESKRDTAADDMDGTDVEDVGDEANRGVRTHGPPSSRRSGTPTEEGCEWCESFPTLGHPTVIVTTYEMALRDETQLAKLRYDTLIVDEAHRLKNKSSRGRAALQALRTEHTFLLTGTPLQNGLLELWSLLNFVLPTLFASSDNFVQWFNAPFEGRQDMRCSTAPHTLPTQWPHSTMVDAPTQTAFKRSACDVVH